MITPLHVFDRYGHLRSIGIPDASPGGFFVPFFYSDLASVRRFTYYHEGAVSQRERDVGFLIAVFFYAVCHFGHYIYYRFPFAIVGLYQRRVPALVVFRVGVVQVSVGRETNDRWWRLYFCYFYG